MSNSNGAVKIGRWLENFIPGDVLEPGEVLEPAIKQSKDLKPVILYTDGACEPNPGRGGYGVVILCDNKRRELSGGFRLTTNSRMEIYAAIAGLRALEEPCKVTLYSDSKYLVNTMNQGWEKHCNLDLWDRLSNVHHQGGHNVTFIWIRGHSGNPENERCDQLACAAALKKDLLPDEGY